MKVINPIQIGSLWKNKSGNIWKVIRLLPGGKVELFDKDRVWFNDTYQYQMRTEINDGSLIQIKP